MFAPTQEISGILSKRGKVCKQSTLIKYNLETYVLLTALKSFTPSGVAPHSRALIMCCLRSTSSLTLSFNCQSDFGIMLTFKMMCSMRCTLSTSWTGCGGGDEVASLFTWTSLTWPRLTTCASFTQGRPQEEGDSKKQNKTRFRLFKFNDRLNGN